MARKEPTPNPDDATPWAKVKGTAILWAIVLLPVIAIVALLVWWARP